MTTRITHALSIAVAVLACGCGDDGDDSDSAEGTAPTIDALSFDPESITAGEQTVLTGQFTFHDEESDADRFAAAIVLPDGSRQAIAPANTQGTMGLNDGQVAFLLAVAPPAAGTYTIELWMLDAADNESNHLEKPLEATAPP